MTRILTIIALLFATPVVADECKAPDLNFLTGGIKTQPICYGSYEKCLKEEKEKKAKEARERDARNKKAVALGYKDEGEMEAARLTCLSVKNHCHEVRAEYKCFNFPPQFRATSSFEELQNRVEELEAEVEQLRNR